MPNIITEGLARTAGYLVSESASMYRSREQVMFLASSADAPAGTIVSQLVTGTATAAIKAGGTGDATSSAVTVGASAETGVYSVEFTEAAKFEVYSPFGVLLGTGTVGTAYSGAIGFTITAGSAPMEVGEGFDITVTAVSGQYQPHTVGGPAVAGILYEGALKGDFALRTITARDAEVNGAHLIYPSGATAGQITTINAALTALGIIVR